MCKSEAPARLLAALLAIGAATWRQRCIKFDATAYLAQSLTTSRATSRAQNAGGAFPVSDYPADYVHTLRSESEQRSEAIERAMVTLEQVVRDLRIALVAPPRAAGNL